MLRGIVCIRTVFIMNLHHGVAIRSDVARLRDGTSCLREVVENSGKGSLSLTAQKEMKRKLQVLLERQLSLRP